MLTGARARRHYDLVIDSVTAKRLGNRLGIRLVYVVGCLIFTLPLALVPSADSVHRVAVLLMLLAAEFASGFGVMVLDIAIGAIFAGYYPGHDALPVSGAVPGDQLPRRPAGWSPVPALTVGFADFHS